MMSTPIPIEQLLEDSDSDIDEEEELYSDSDIDKEEELSLLGTVKRPSVETQASTSQRRREFGNAEVKVKQEGEETLATLDDLEALDCPICFEPLRPPVYQCNEGHLACDSCCKKITSCPSCTQVIGARCRAIERIVQSARMSCVNKQHGCTEKVCYSWKLNHEQKDCKYAPVPCVNRQHGCPEKLSHAMKLDHEQNKCIYAPVSCPCCQYVGTSKQLYAHFAKQHPSSAKPITLNLFVQLTVDKDVTQIVLQESVYETLFVLNHFIVPHGSLVTVTCVGLVTPGLKFSYELMAGSGKNQICLKNLVEFSQNASALPPKENFLLITKDFHRKIPFGRSCLTVSLKIKKLS